MERLKLIDDIRTQALSMMKEDANLSYEDASKKARMELTGEDTLITRYHQGIEMKKSYLEIAKKEISSNIRVDLYQEDQLKEMIVASRLGVDLEEFINIFLTPDQIHFITLASLKGEDVTKYVMNLYFDPKEEMERLMSEEMQNDSPVMDIGYQKILSTDGLKAA